MTPPEASVDGPSVEAVRAALSAAESTQSRLNAFVRTFDQEALRLASAADERLRLGAALGALDGIPYAAKDNLFVAGRPVSAGSPKWSGHSPKISDPAIDRLSAAGAVLVGTTTLPEMGVGQVTENATTGITRNPIDPRLTPGGSSGGSAAAVAAGVVPFALGTDGGGSARNPASLTGILGMKTARGTIPRTGGFPQLVPGFQTLGILAGSTTVLRAVLDTVGDRGRGPRVRVRTRAPRRIAMFRTVDDVRCDPQVAARLDAAATAFAAHGIEVVPVMAPFSWRRLSAAWETIAAVGAMRAFAVAPVPDAPSSAVLEALALRGPSVTGGDYRVALDDIDEIARDCEAAFVDVDAVLCPASVGPAWEVGGTPAYSDGSSLDGSSLSAFTMWVNATGHAALSVPATPLDDGRPLGVQLVETGAGEHLLLDLAELLLTHSQEGNDAR